MWTLYLFVVYFGPKVLKLVAVGVVGGLFLAVLMCVLSLIADWVWTGLNHFAWSE